MKESSPFEDGLFLGSDIKELIDDVAHDIQGPISLLEQYVSAASGARGKKSPSDHETREAAAHSIEKIKRLIGELKAFITSAELKVDLNDFAACIRSALAEKRTAAAEKGVVIEYSGPKHLIGSFDAMKVERAISNMISNAIDACDPMTGKISVRLSIDDETVWIEIEDNGCGIPADLLPFVFERGFTFGKLGGSGLGLSSCSRIMELHGGKIFLSSTEDKGSIFSLCFPRAAAMSASIDDGLCEVKMFREDAAGCEKWLMAISESYTGALSLEDYESRSLRLKAGEITLDPI
jgi:signal transduction histidine kinase